MTQAKKTIVTIFGIGLLAALIGVAAWFNVDRPKVLEELCQGGLPNFSRPAEVRKTDLDCNILGGKRRVKGILLTGFEASNFITADLGTPATGESLTGGTWFTCNQVKGCDPRVDAELEQSARSNCGTGFAEIVVDGWPTVNPGRYGHMGMYAREFFADRVISVGPAPEEFTKQWKERVNRSGIDEKECEEMSAYRL